MFFALKLCTLFTCPNGFDPISSLLLYTELEIHPGIPAPKLYPIRKSKKKHKLGVDHSPKKVTL